MTTGIRTPLDPERLTAELVNELVSREFWSGRPYVPDDLAYGGGGSREFTLAELRRRQRGWSLAFDGLRHWCSPEVSGRDVQTFRNRDAIAGTIATSRWQAGAVADGSLPYAVWGSPGPAGTLYANWTSISFVTGARRGPIAYRLRRQSRGWSVHIPHKSGPPIEIWHDLDEVGKVLVDIRAELPEKPEPEGLIQALLDLYA